MFLLCFCCAQLYTDWEQLVPPNPSATAAQLNNATLLDYRRFSSDALIGLFSGEKRAILETPAVSSSRPLAVLTNILAFHSAIDQWALHREATGGEHGGGPTAVALDIYPEPAAHRAPGTTGDKDQLKPIRQAACALDLARSAGSMVDFATGGRSSPGLGNHGRPFLLMEQP